MNESKSTAILAAIVSSLTLSCGAANAATPQEQFVTLALDLCGNVGSGASAFEERAAAIPKFKMGPAQALTEEYGNLRKTIAQVLGVEAGAPIRIAIIDEAPQAEVLAFLRTDYKACVATQRGDTQAGNALQERLSQPDSGWEEIIGVPKTRSWQRPGEAGQVVTLMTITNPGISLAGASLEMGAMPRISLHDTFAGLVVPQCLASLLEKRPLHASKLEPYIRPGKAARKGEVILVQSEFPLVRVSAPSDKPGCKVFPSIPRLDYEPLGAALAKAFLAQPGAEELVSHGLQTPGARVWRIRDAEAFLVIITEPEFFAIFAPAKD